MEDGIVLPRREQGTCEPLMIATVGVNSYNMELGRGAPAPPRATKTP